MAFTSRPMRLRRSFSNQSFRSRRKLQPSRFRPLLESLEDRVVLATLAVNSLADTSNLGGVLTLRDAILVENGALSVANLSTAEQTQISGTLNAPGGDTIQFAPALAG